LRFICPALISPEAYGLESDNHQVSGTRSILLITKILQKMASGGKFGNKEEFMDPLNDFLDENQRKMDSFLDRCATSGNREDIKLEISDSGWEASMIGVASLMKINKLRVQQELQTYNVGSMESELWITVNDICF